MTTSNDDATTQFPQTDATTPLPTTPAPAAGTGQDATREMPTSDPLAIFREEPTAQMPADPFRSDADASGAAGTQGAAGAHAQASSHSDPLGSTRTAFDPAATGEETPSFAHEAGAHRGAEASAGGPGNGQTDGAGQQTWSAPRGPVDMRTLPEAPSKGVRVGSFVWAALVCMAGLFLIAEAFIPSFNLPILGITAVAALGIVLIVTALFSGRGNRAGKATQAPAGGAADAIRRG